MKDVFDPESKKALIDYRIERAYETLKEAKYNSDELYPRAAKFIDDVKTLLQ